MPVHAIDWNPDTKTLAIIHARKCTIAKVGGKINIDQTPTFDRSTKPWGITEGNEFLAGQLTGQLSDAEKVAAVVRWTNEFCFMFIFPLSSFPDGSDPDIGRDPYLDADPASPNAWWSDEHGVPDAAGLFVTEQHIELIDFDAAALLNDDVLFATIQRIG